MRGGSGPDIRPAYTQNIVYKLHIKIEEDGSQLAIKQLHCYPATSIGSLWSHWDSTVMCTCGRLRECCDRHLVQGEQVEVDVGADDGQRLLLRYRRHVLQYRHALLAYRQS